MTAFSDQDPKGISLSRQLKDKFKVVRDLLDNILINEKKQPEMPSKRVDLPISEMFCEDILTEIDSGFRFLIKLGGISSITDRMILFGDYKIELSEIQLGIQAKISDDFSSEVKTCFSKILVKLNVLLSYDFQIFIEACRESFESVREEGKRELSIDLITKPLVDFLESNDFELFELASLKEESYQFFNLNLIGDKNQKLNWHKFNETIEPFVDSLTTTYENRKNNLKMDFMIIKLNLEEALRNMIMDIMRAIYTKLDTFITHESDYEYVKTFLTKFTDRLNFIYSTLVRSKNSDQKIDLFIESSFWLYDELTKKHKIIIGKLLNFEFERKVNLINPSNLEAAKLLEKHYHMLLDIKFIENSIKLEEFIQTITSDKEKLTKVKWIVRARSHDPNFRLLFTVLHIFKEGKIIKQEVFENYKSIVTYVSKRFSDKNGEDIELSKSVFSEWRTEFYKNHKADLDSYLSSRNTKDWKKLLQALKK